MREVILAGMGSWGAGWYTTLRERFGPGAVIVVDPSPATAQRLLPGDLWYPALESVFADFPEPLLMVNAAPPKAHPALNRLCFSRGIPVLCEKPIAATLQESRLTVEAARNAGVPLMIAENFRRGAVMRRAAEILHGGTLGRVASIHAQLFQEYRTDKPYWAEFRHAFLEDVVIHILDLVRFFVRDSVSSVTARSYNPPGSWHPTNACASLLLDFESGPVFSFSGGLASCTALTGWTGDWRIEGSLGTLHIRQQSLRVCLNSGEQQEEDLSRASAPGCLDDFLALLAGDPEPQTMGEDYLLTQELVHLAVQSADTRSTIRVPASIPPDAPL